MTTIRHYSCFFQLDGRRGGTNPSRQPPSLATVRVVDHPAASMDLKAQHIRFCTSRDGTRIAYAVCGSGPPLVFVAHFVHHLKFDWDSPVWQPWISALARRHTLIRYDFRGVGLSDRDHVDFSFEKLVDDFEAVVKAARVERFALFAMTAGARIVMPYVVRNPDRVSHLVLYGTSPSGPLTRRAPAAQTEDMRLQLKAMELGWPQEIPGYGTFFASLHIPDATPEQSRSFNDLLRLTTTPKNAVSLLHTLVESDMHDLLPQVRCPTLVLHARQSAVLRFDDGRAVAALVPDARFVPLESRNHILLESEPAWQHFINEIEEFLPASEGAPAPLLDELTARERDILELVAQGLSNDQVSARLKISEKTVRNHVSTVLSKIGASSRAQAVAIARDAGFGQRIKRAE
jgi:pimeloyl-ACP methyl ester carboxylesterase/DNA-binding CsgD family transcriptional regulator